MWRIRKTMLEHDILVTSTLIGVPRTKKEIEKELSYYRTPEAGEFDTYIAHLLNLPFKREVEWNHERRRVEVVARLTEDITLDIKGHKISLRSGEKILLAISHRYPFEKITTIFHNMKFLTEHITTTKDRRYMLGFYGIRKERPMGNR